MQVGDIATAECWSVGCRPQRCIGPLVVHSPGHKTLESGSGILASDEQDLFVAVLGRLSLLWRHDHHGVPQELF